MSQRSDKYLKDIPMVPYDLLREGAVRLGILVFVISVFAAVFRSSQDPQGR